MLASLAVTALCGLLVSSHPLPQPSFNCSFPISPTCELAPGQFLERRGMSSGMGGSSAKGETAGKSGSLHSTSSALTHSTRATQTISRMLTQTPTPAQQPTPAPTLAPTFAAGPPTRVPTTNSQPPLANVLDKNENDSSATLYLFITFVVLMVIVLILTCLKVRRDRRSADASKDGELIVANKVVLPPVENGDFDNEYLEPVVGGHYDFPDELVGDFGLYQ